MMKMAGYKIFAAIELGSAGINMKIAKLSKKNKIDIIDSVKCEIPLGRQSYTEGKISYCMVSEICGCFEKYLLIMKEYGTDDYVCYATTAVREASNSEYIIDQINIRTGIKVNIISNEEERFLHNKAFAFNNCCFDSIIQDGAVIADVSSGSVQVSFYEKSSLQFSQNIPMGSLKVLELLSEKDKEAVLSQKILEDFIKSNIKNYKKVFFKNPDFKHFAAIGNQTEYIKKICKSDGNIIKKEDIENVYKTVSQRNEEYIEKAYEIPYDSAQLILPSVLFYKMFIEDFEKDEIIMPDVYLTDGIIVEYAEKNDYTHTNHIFTEDIISSAKYYAGKYDVSSRHYNKIMDIGTCLMTALSKKFGFSKRNLILFKVASIFADTGYYININDYNRYSYDIVKANPILGLSSKENEIISCVVLFQNGVFNYPEYNGYSKNRKLLISKLASVLALSKALDVEYNQKIEKTESSVRNGSLIITAYTDENITLEKREFEIASEFFEEVFGIKAVLVKKGLKK